MKNTLKRFMVIILALLVTSATSVPAFPSSTEQEFVETFAVPDEEIFECDDESIPGSERDYEDVTLDIGIEEEAAEFADAVWDDETCYEIEFETQPQTEAEFLVQASDDDDDADDGDDDDDSGDDPEEPEEHEPEEIKHVNIGNVNTCVYSYRTPVYSAIATEGNVSIREEQWTCVENGKVNRKSGYYGGVQKFTKFEDGLTYRYSIEISANDDDYFTDNTQFIIGGKVVHGTFSAGNTYFSVSGLYSLFAQCAHEYKTITTPATCTTDGRKYKKCKYCQNEILIQTLSATGHNYELDEDKCEEANCTINGKIVYVCSKCDDVKTENIPAIGHHFSWDKEESLDPTCTKAGYKLFACTNEGCEESYQEPIEAIGHHFAHDKEESLDPTCTKPGYKLFACTNEGCEESYQEPIEAIGHNFKWDKEESLDPTCVKEGYKLFACTNDGCEESYQEAIPATGHHFSLDKEESLDPTCEQEGYRLYACTNEGCEESYQEAVPATGHKYGLDKEESVAPTCEKDGFNYYACRNGECDSYYTVPVAKTGHTYKYDEESSVDPTCTSKGYKKYICTNDDCTASYKETIPATGHKFELTILKPATDKTEGTYCYACTNPDCEATQNKQTIFPYKTVKLGSTSYQYTGKAIVPDVKVLDVRGVAIDPKNYVVVCYDNVNAGTAKVHVTFSNMYKGTLTATFKIKQGKQKITTSKNSYKVNYSSVQKKDQTVNLDARSKTGLTFSSSDKKYITISKGKVKIKKGTPKGTYTVTIKAKETKSCKGRTKKVRIVVK